jgi:cell division ATPase FtsA
MFSFFKKEKEKTSLLIDIQSGLIRGCLISQKENSNPVISKLITRDIPRKNHTNSHYLNKMMLKTFSEIMHMLTETNHVESINIILSSPWILSHSKTIKIDFTDEKEVTEEMVLKIIDDERNKLEDIYKKSDIDTTENIYSDLQYIEQKVFDVKLNGYEISDYIGKKARDIEVSFSMTLSSKIILNRLNKVISRFIKAKEIKFSSGLLLNYIALRKIMPDINNYVYMHVHSELTDIIVVQKGLCSHFSSFPIGTANLIRKISRRMTQNDTVTDSMISLYQGKKLESLEEKKIGRIIGDYSEEWFSQYKKTLEVADIATNIPRIYFLSTHSHIEIYKDILNTKIGYEIRITDFAIEKINSAISYEKTSDKNQLIEMYAYALDGMI